MSVTLLSLPHSCLLVYSLVRRYGSLTRDMSSVMTDQPCAPAEGAVKSGEAETQSETDAVNVRHEDYGTTGTTSLQVICLKYSMLLYLLCGHDSAFLIFDRFRFNF